MSSKDDPFGSGGKTVIRPNPGGAARPDPLRPSPVPGPQRAGQPGQPVPAYPQQQPAPPPLPYAPSASPFGPQSATPYRSETANRYGMPQPESDAWMRGADPAKAFFPNAGEQPQAPPDPVQKIPLEVALNARDGIEYSAANPITAAAAPLLILLGRLRLMIIDMHAVPLMNHVATMIREFEKKVLESGVPREDAMVAKYALCGTADDIVQNLPGTDRHVWLQYSMLAQFFQVRTSGVGFFEELNKILANPAAKYDLLELMHACLSLGFEGQYRGMAGGDRELQKVRRDVYEALRRVKARADDDISPRWQGMTKLMRNMGDRIPLWAIAAGVAGLLVGAYFLFRFLISTDGDALADKLLALNPDGQITLERAAFVPFAGPDFTKTAQLDRIRGALAEEIAAGGLGVDTKGNYIVIEINNLLLFDSGKADVKPEFQTIAQRIAAALNPEPGPINITGHTDNVKLRKTNAFKSNYELSLARAKAVEAIVAAQLTDASRIVVAGKGEDEPIEDNKTAEGRAKNRRVDIMIAREETL
jgi:type VI secretion system protein ImpK